ncbi:pro-neuregulin-3, membrane-bound isoform isoform X2 [Denticeps clupeoides]|uniref:pro-neuregulin-3, membrane-bound isoform isoform X2 n=1 Tax=Denticeps clupeoides TaxID=299321 RepID=UPI0010A2D130|nr:pro-neuregulin-3, membrane-bound isoform-like isoform X2 [Denticeps clupeoides]
MSDRPGALLGANPNTTTSMATLTLEEPGGDQASPRAAGALRCGPCALWPRQQTWLCVVPLLMGFVGLGLSLMLLKWIVVGSVQDYVPTDLVDAKGIGQDPIFLSKPSTLPKGLDTTTTTTAIDTAATGANAGTSSSSRAADGTGQRTRSGSPINHTSTERGGGQGSEGSGVNRAPHLHNQIGSRVPGLSPGSASTTMTTTTTIVTASTSARTSRPSAAKEPTPKSTTVRRGNGGNGSRQNSPPLSSTTQPPATISTLPASAKPTQRWTHGRSSKGPSSRPTRPHHRFRTLAPTNLTLRSEHFKPCPDKEMAFCLNDGECFIVETVAGVHRQCRCKERYHGLRCDQFVPKTDSILSDPTDELGIEFMESRETYQRQVLSIFSIAMGIGLLGVACVALYCRNKRQREKHLGEGRHLRDCSINASSLMTKSSPRPQCALRLEKCCKAHESSLPQGGSAAPIQSPPIASSQGGALPRGKRFRSGSLSLSPTQKKRGASHRSASCWTPPIVHSRNSLIGSRDSIQAYKHLKELEPAETDSETMKRCKSQMTRDHHHSAILSVQVESSPRQLLTMAAPSVVPCTRLDQGMVVLPLSPLANRTPPVPIIPSVQGQKNCEEGLDGADVHQAVGSEARLGSSEGPGYTLASPSKTVLGSGATSKHKSLVTYMTALGSGARTSRVNTVISVTALGPGGHSTEYRARLCPASAVAQREEPGRVLPLPLTWETVEDTGLHDPVTTESRGVACATSSAS